MSGKSKLEKDYEDYNHMIEQKAKAEKKNIAEKIKKVEKEAAQIGVIFEPHGKNKS